jgi:hypothetical protein
MPSRTVLVVLTIALCATLALGTGFRASGRPGGCLDAFADTLDVAVEIVSPTTSEDPGLVTVAVRLTNVGNVLALVPRFDVHIQPPGYSDYRENIAIGIGANQVVTLSPWVYSGGTETCTAYITYPEDMNHHNDTAVVIVNATGISGPAEMEPHAGMSLALLPSPLAGNVLHVGYSLNQAGPAKVTLFDISGRPVAKRDFAGTSTGELPLDLHLLSGGVYLVRLDDGHQSVVRTLVVQR